MNNRLEKCLMIGALGGWLASMGALVVLAVQASSLDGSVKSVQFDREQITQLNQRYSLERDSLGVEPSANRSSSAVKALIPNDTSQGYWLDSLREVPKSALVSNSRSSRIDSAK